MPAFGCTGGCRRAGSRTTCSIPQALRSEQRAKTDRIDGEQQMLALGRAMMSEPKLLCLDEPSLGLAPRIAQDIFRTIREIKTGLANGSVIQATDGLAAGEKIVARGSLFIDRAAGGT